MTLQDLLNAPEGEQFEFKRAENSYEFDKLVKYACAFANCGGGKIILGISDQRPRQITGSAAFPQPERTRNALVEKLHIRVDFQLHEHEGKRVLIFEIAGRPAGLPVQADGVAWWREGDSLVPMPADVRRRIYGETGHDFSGDICDGATLDDLDENAVAVFREKWLFKSGNPRLKQLSTVQVLQDCEAMIGNGITYAALVLFGKRASLGRFLPQAETVFEYRSSDASGPAQQREEFRAGFFAFQERIWELVNLRNDRQHYQDGLFVFDIPTFNERVIREALLNAICHRNYQLAGSVFVRQYRDRLVIDSPGGLPPEITLKNILDHQSPRNRRMAEILARCGLVERSGQGMNLIYELSIKEAKALPNFTGTDDYLVRITLNGMVLDKRLLSVLEKIGTERLESFSTEDFLVVNDLFHGHPLSENLRERKKRLIELGVVEQIGRNKFVLARQFYKAVGKDGTHARLVGLDKNTNKELLLKHINASHGAKLAELQQVLPGHSRFQVQALLRELRAAGCVLVIGKNRGAKWIGKETE